MFFQLLYLPFCTAIDWVLVDHYLSWLTSTGPMIDVIVVPVGPISCLLGHFLMCLGTHMVGCVHNYFI